MAVLSKKVLIPVLCVTLGACAFKKDDDKATPEQTKLADDVVKKIQDGKDEINVQLKEGNVSIAFEDSEPGYYQMVVTWPDNVGSMEVHLDGNFLQNVVGKNSIKIPVPHSQKRTVRLRAFASPANGGRLLSEFESEYESPKDAIFNDNTFLNENMEYSVHRLYFNKKAHVYTNGNDLKITTDQLIVIQDENATQGRPEDTFHIVTFRDPAVATSITGKNSFIEIRATNAIGNLKIALTGRNGADGQDGLDQARATGKVIPPAQAANGTNGQDGQITLPKPCNMRNTNSGCAPAEPKCMAQPTNGGNGADGLPGFDGLDGVNGGATGNLFVDVTDDSQFSLEIYRRPGKGGRGGKGSPGQLGGKGGAPGDNKKICRSAQPGNNGKDGEAGKNGVDGKDGQVGEVITRVKNIKFL